MQVEVDVQLIPDRLSPRPDTVPGFGVDMIVQDVPSQDSASVFGVPLESLYVPTAMHAVEDVHQTPDSWLEVAPDGFGVDCTVQSVPFQASANVAGLLLKVLRDPTAVHAAEELHDTAS